jgi:hypothetical protein
MQADILGVLKKETVRKTKDHLEKRKKQLFYNYI